MHFALIDRILRRDEDSLVAIKHVSAAEEYLQDHFPSYPVLPGVMMLEAMVQAARALLNTDTPHVLGKVAALKYGSFVRPGDSILVQATRTRTNEDGSTEFRGEVRLVLPGSSIDAPDLPKAAAGKLTLRPMRSSPRAGLAVGSVGQTA